MKYIVSVEQMRKIDKESCADYGMHPLVLMENAANAVAKEVVALLPQKVIVFCGSGDNGGDGYAAARWLRARNIETLIVAMNHELSDSAKTNRDIAREFGIDIIEYRHLHSEHLANADVYVDALLGTGITRDVKGELFSCIELINNKPDNVTVVSVDIPSGINANSGEIMGIAVKAHRTVSFGYAKYGHVLYPGREYTGILSVEEICTHKDAPLIDRIIEKDDLSCVFAPRNANTHKGDYGKVAVIGGTTSMEGAIMLAGSAALKTGVGLVTLGVPKSNYRMYASRMPELMAKPLDALDNGDTRELDLLCERKDCLAFGNGAVSSYAKYILKHILDTYDIPIVIDADGLNALSGDLSLLKEGNKAILTPHYGEMSRLLSVDVSQVEKEPLKCARELASRTRSIVLLKGSTTIISSPDGRTAFNTIGSPGLATAGSGDVLAGIITALVARGFNLFQAAVLGAGLHGFCGELASKKFGENYMTASNVIDFLRNPE